MRTWLFAVLLASSPANAQSQAGLQQQVEAKLAEAGPGVRFGLVVMTPDGRELVALNPDGRFMPASNTKLFTTIAAYELLPGLDQPDVEGGARVRMERAARGAPDVILEGHGDARLSSAPDCRSDCLSTLADAVAARTRKVGRVIGDARAFADDRWSFGMSWNNIPTRSGTALAALMIDGNELALSVAPGAAGRPPRIAVGDYLEVVNEAVTVADGKTDLSAERLPGSAGRPSDPCPCSVARPTSCSISAICSTPTSASSVWSSAGPARRSSSSGGSRITSRRSDVAALRGSLV